MENTIAITDLQIGYQQKPVVKNINLIVRPGEILGLLGPSGSGKTTLIRAIMGMIKPMSGTVRVFGQAMPNFWPSHAESTPAGKDWLYGTDGCSIRYAYSP